MILYNRRMMMRFGKTAWFISFILMTLYGLKAQDRLSPLSFNPVLKQYTQQGVLKSFQATTDTLDLPFIDDFSSSAPYPDPNKWLNNYVFVNNQFAANPMSIGVATFDGYDPSGQLYTKTDLDGMIDADTLTSAPIFLAITPEPGNSIFLTFYYQIGGLAPGITANNHEITPDSLVLEFYNPTSGRWYEAWSTIPDALTTTFERVDVEITDSLRRDGFQFRLRNKIKRYDNNTSPDGFYAYAPWHIDYVMLQEGQEDDPRPTQDVAFTGEGDFLFKDGYKSIPWPHYSQAQSSILNNEMTMFFSNFNFPNNGFANSPSFTIREEISGYEELGARFNGTFTMTEQRDSLTLTSLFILDPTGRDSALLSVTYEIDDVPLNLDIESNNTFTIQYPSYDYYAYDDGSAEGVLQAFRNSYWASSFNAFMADTLRAVDIYFIPSYDKNNVTRRFNLYVWDDEDGRPGNVLLEKTGNVVEFDEERNGFVRYYLEPQDSLVVGGRFYIGIKNVTFQGNRIGIGLDANSHVHNTFFVNDNNQWSQDTENIPFALMIRPVMGKKVEIPVSVPKTGSDPASIDLYPNPARDRVHIKGIPASLQRHYQVLVYTTTGQLVSSYESQSSFGVSHLQEGIYIIAVKGPGWKKVKKLIIAR